MALADADECEAISANTSNGTNDAPIAVDLEREAQPAKHPANWQIPGNDGIHDSSAKQYARVSRAHVLEFMS
jgi:hypothetical protein